MKVGDEVHYESRFDRVSNIVMYGKITEIIGTHAVLNVRGNTCYIPLEDLIPTWYVKRKYNGEMFYSYNGVRITEEHYNRGITEYELKKSLEDIGLSDLI